MFNSSVTFSGSAPGISGAPILPGGSGSNDYIDGFVRPDISGSTDGLTWNWSYLNDSQYDPANGGSLAFTSSIRKTALASTFRNRDNPDSSLGFEVFADLELGEIGGSSSKITWGTHFGFHYANLNSGEAATSTGRATTTTTVDRYPLEGVIPPLAPYTGSFNGPGPLLESNATSSSSVVPGKAFINHSNDLDTDLYSFNIGPWIAFVPTERFSLQAEVGITFAFADATYKSASTTSLPGGISTSIGSHASKTDFLPGFYLGTTAAYAITRQLDVYLSARYQYLDSLSIRTTNSRAELSFDESFILSTGLRFSF